MDTNYFVCTLGEAEHVPGGRPFQDVSHLLQNQSQDHAHLPAIGFYRVPESRNGGQFQHEILTFEQVYRGILVTATLLSTSWDVLPGETIGLLASSSPEFLFTWLGCIRLGHPVLIIAPECAADGVASLCQSCDASLLIVDEKTASLGKQASETGSEHGGLRCMQTPFAEDDVFKIIRSNSQELLPSLNIRGHDVAYLHHTSGTSSGMPKPIPQSQRAAVGVLPCIDGKDRATFTTTPLYHGGPADIFRAWASNAMIWLFPSKDIPITASNIGKCLDCAKRAAERQSSPPVRYFGAVPYVLQMLAEDDASLDWLQSMDLVSVGGAALPQQIGDFLVQKGVNLVSRFGSAECGFLLSSHRDYNNDRDWQYLRLSDRVTQLSFERREDGLDELIVGPGWPHMAKTNRDDGTYATSDLFEPHPQISNAHKYHSRADAQLTLITGKKFDPAPLEDSLRRASSMVADVLVFANSRPYPGALVFRSKEAVNMTDDEIIKSIESEAENASAEGPSQATLSWSMLIPMPYAGESLPKSSKGTVLRKQAEERYAICIDRAYQEPIREDNSQCSDQDLPHVIKDIVIGTKSSTSSLTESTDLFSFGIDSVAAVQVRHQLQRLLPQDAGRLPISVVEDCGTIKILVDFITNLRHGRHASLAGSESDTHVHMWELVERYSYFNALFQTSPAVNGCNGTRKDAAVVVLTGATGGLGAHVLDGLRRDTTVSQIYCLVRGVDACAARQRVSKALSQRRLMPLNSSADDDKVVVLQAILGDAKLGLSDYHYDKIARETTQILHLAWSVNFRMKLKSFEKDSIASVHNLVNLALASCHLECPRFVFCSSVASVMASHHRPIPEASIKDPASASDTGYSQSKWVAEQICNRASMHPRLRGKVSICRVGQVSGDRETGIWNMKEAWPLMLSTVKLTGSLPDLVNEVLDWLPVDLAAQAMIEAAIGAPASDNLMILHVINDNNQPVWRDMLHWLGKITAFDVVSPSTWIQQLETLAEQGSSHSALQLVDHWKKTLLPAKDFNMSHEQEAQIRFATDITKRSLTALSKVQSVDEAYSNKLWAWISPNSPGEQNHSYAYTTLLTRASYLAGVIMLAYTLRKRGSQFPLIVLYTSSLSEAALKILRSESQSLNLILHYCIPLLPPDHDKMPLIAQRFTDTWTKLRIFELFDYELICYLDADMAIFNQNMDDVFSLAQDLPHDHLAANHVCCCNLDDDSWAPKDWTQQNCPYTPLSHPSALTKPTSIEKESRATHHLLNGGLLLYRPNRDLWDRMMHFFKTSDNLRTYMFPDQDFLADFLRDRWSPIGWQWNALKTMRHWHTNIWRDEEVRCLHYIVDKPWAARISSEGPKAGTGGYKGLDGVTHQWWWDEYSDWADTRRTEGRGDVVEGLSKHVAPTGGGQSIDPDMKSIQPPPDCTS